MRLRLPLWALFLLVVGMAASAPSPTPPRIADFIQQLGSPKFAQRQAAGRALRDIGEPALSALRQAAQDGTDAEIRRRATLLIRAIEVRVYGPIRQYRGHAGGIWSLAFSPDGKVLASAGTDKTVKLWDVANGKHLATLRGHSSLVLSIAFSPDGKTLASGSWDQTIKLWDVATATALQTFKGHTKVVLSVAFSPDGKTVASGGWDHTIKLWDVATAASTATLHGHTGWVLAVAFSPDGKVLASAGGDQSLKLWDVATGQELRTLVGHRGLVKCVTFLPADGTIVSGGMDSTLRYWDGATGQSRRTVITLMPSVRSVAVSEDGKTLASAVGNVASEWGDVILWDVATGNARATLNSPSAVVQAVAFAPDGKVLASADADGTIKLWDVVKQLAPTVTPGPQVYVSRNGKPWAIKRITMRTLLVIAAVLACNSSAWGQAARRPNILWITCEDIGPHLGCYGDRYAVSPNLDRLAARGILYRHAWSNAPVCAPARTSIITGLYPTSTGAEHMRSMTRLPSSIRMFPALLRQAGYYCTNHIKEDYNLAKDGGVWDESSKKAHWKNRKPGQPFFAVFNILITHESQIRARPHKLVHDPARAPLPAYHPDTPEVRHDWAQYYDNITTMDEMAGKLLRELEEAGLAEDTIIFFYGDHGSGMPRHKRFPYNSGLQVPLICYIPSRFRNLAPKDYVPGGRTERLVSFVDLAPTMLSLAGVEPPESMQGHAFMGKYEAAPQPYLYGFRGRMDERYDLIRSVRDQRYVYVRNYLPHKIGGQHVAYMFVTPTTRVWKQLYDAGKLKPPQTYFWEARPPEELYDLTSDPDEVKNLAASPAHSETLERLRRAEQAWVLNVRDVGFLPEGEIHSRSQASSPYEMGHDENKYPLKKIFHAADVASSLKAGVLPELKTALEDSDSTVRYWAALGILMRGKEAVATTSRELRKSLADSSPYVRIVAAEALGHFGTDADLKASLAVLLELAPLDKNGLYVSMYALNALDSLGRKAGGARAAIAALPRSDPAVNARMKDNVRNLIEHILTNLQ